MALELGLLLADDALLERALEFLDGARDAQLFLMDDGVRAVNDPRLRALSDAGVEIALCAMDAEARGIAEVAHARFGSQYDHAKMIRDARRVVAMTGARLDGSPRIDVRQFAAPAHNAENRRSVQVRVTRDARHDKTRQALRAAVAYAACDLQVSIAIDPPARALLLHDDHPPLVLRSLATLRGLGCPISVEPRAADLEVAW